MADDRHPLDKAAGALRKLEAQAIEAQDASPDFWELSFSAEESLVGNYPQAMNLNKSDLVQLGSDGFPNVPDGLPPQKLKSSAKWTDVLSANLWSNGYLLNEKALALFRKAELGEFREYPTVVSGRKGATRNYTYVFVKNVIEPDAFDFNRSEFHITNMLGIPVGPIEINSFEEWLSAIELSKAGKLEGARRFYPVAFKKLYFLDGSTPTVDLFELKRLSAQTYVSTRFKDAARLAGVTGLEIKHNRRLFAG